MSTIPPVSIIDKVREYIADGRIKDGIDLLWDDLKRLSLSEPFFHQAKNELLLLRSKLMRLNAEKRAQMIHFAKYDLQCSIISKAILDLLELLDAEVKEVSQEQPLSIEASQLYKAELVLDLDFENATDEEIQAVLNRIGTILRTKPNELKILAKKRGSIVVEMELSAETLVRLKSLTRIELVKELIDVKSLEEGWEWIDRDEFVLNLKEIKLNKADLSKTDLSEANLSGTNLFGANLMGANLMSANLMGANLFRADLRGANLSYTNLREANLSEANLSEANLSFANLSGDSPFKIINHRLPLDGADLREADLSRADLRGADLNWAKLDGAIFHISQFEILQSMQVNISTVIFVDDEGKEVENFVEVQ